MKKSILLIFIALLCIGGYAQENGTEQQDVNQYGVVVQSRPVEVTEQDGILVMKGKDPDSHYKLWFDIRVQADGAIFFGNDKNFDRIGDGVSIRRARFAVKSQINRNWYGEFDLDLANGEIELKDAIIRYTGLKNLQIQLGNFKEFFSIQRNTTSRYLQFMERPMATTMAPSRHLGLNVKYAGDYLWASAGVFAQEVKGLEELEGVKDNNKDFGRGPGLAYTGKFVLRPLARKQDASLHLGVAASYRNPTTATDPGDYGSARISTRNTTSINRKKYLDTDDVKHVDHELLYTFEVAGHHRGLRYEAAVIGDHMHMEDCAADTGTKKFWGWYAQAGYLLFGGNQQYDAGGAKYTKVRRGRKWGDLELCLRYEYIDLNSREIRGGSADAFSAGINFYVNDNVKMVLNYQYNNNDRYANGKGKLLTGYDADGVPTKDYIKIVSKHAGVDYHMLGMRFEIDF